MRGTSVHIHRRQYIFPKQMKTRCQIKKPLWEKLSNLNRTLRYQIIYVLSWRIAYVLARVLSLYFHRIFAPLLCAQRVRQFHPILYSPHANISTNHPTFSIMTRSAMRFLQLSWINLVYFVLLINWYCSIAVCLVNRFISKILGKISTCNNLIDQLSLRADNFDNAPSSVNIDTR